LINDLELLHAGLGVLMAHYVASDLYAVRHCLLRVSRQLWIIAEHEDLARLGLAAPLPDHGGALAGACDPRARVSEAAIESHIHPLKNEQSIDFRSSYTVGSMVPGSPARSRARHRDPRRPCRNPCHPHR
jgi:hypothetical protein